MLTGSQETNQNYIEDDFSVIKDMGSGAGESKKLMDQDPEFSLLTGRLLQLTAHLYSDITCQFLWLQ